MKNFKMKSFIPLKLKKYLIKHLDLVVAITVILSFRWIAFDHYVIPSGSMVPNLLVFDHIVVKKYPYGFRIPGSKSWLWKNRNPKRGEIVIFRSVEGKYFMVKRVIGIPGDRIVIKGHTITINGKELKKKPLHDGDIEGYYPITSFDLGDDVNNYNFYLENLDDRQYRVLWSKEDNWNQVYNISVPEGQFFVLGDNRSNSKDSRYWGFLPFENLMGEGYKIWLSCEKTFFNLPILCHPNRLRISRMLSNIE